MVYKEEVNEETRPLIWNNGKGLAFIIGPSQYSRSCPAQHLFKLGIYMFSAYFAPAALFSRLAFLSVISIGNLRIYKGKFFTFAYL